VCSRRFYNYTHVRLQNTVWKIFYHGPHIWFWLKQSIYETCFCLDLQKHLTKSFCLSAFTVFSQFVGRTSREMFSATSWQTYYFAPTDMSSLNKILFRLKTPFIIYVLTTFKF
jgi:hypothetical protein